MRANRLSYVVATLLSRLRASLPAWGADKLHLERMDLKRAPTVRMFLSYIDGDGHVVTGKTKDDFKLSVDANDQGFATEVTTTEASLAEPINMVIVVQVTPSMNEVIEEAKKGVRMRRRRQRR